MVPLPERIKDSNWANTHTQLHACSTKTNAHTHTKLQNSAGVETVGVWQTKGQLGQENLWSGSGEEKETERLD